MGSISKKQKRKLIKILLTALAALIVFVGNLSASSDSSYVHYFDVGQGNASLIQTKSGQTILIDGGPDASVLGEMGSVLPFYDRHIDIMILSHPHFDHVFGLLKVLERYEVDKIVITGAVHTTDAYLDFLNEIKKYDVEIVEGYKKIVLNDVSYLEFLYPLTNVYGQTFKNVNDTSIVTRFVEGKTSFLFPGDVEMVSEQELVASGLELKSDVLMAPHQGSKTSSSLEFLKAVDPKLVIISVGEGNDYGHPHKEVVDRYQGLGIRYLRTDYEGTITIETNGDEYFVK